MIDNTLMEMPEQYDPLEEGFRVVGIEKDVCFLQQINLCIDEAGNTRGIYHYPNAEEELKHKLIVHEPNEIWGFDSGKLIIGVVSSKHMSDGTTYSWHKDDTEIKTGQNCCFIPICSPGRYAVTVYHGVDSETTQPVLVREVAKFSNQFDFSDS
jgi:hypothetical protein